MTRLLGGFKQLLSLPPAQRWPAIKRAVKMGLAASAGSFLAASTRLQEVADGTNWLSLLSPHKLHEFLLEHEDILNSIGRSLAVAVFTAILTALAEVTTQGPRDRRKSRQGVEGRYERLAREADLYRADTT